jgi:hypothetical protein
MDKLAQEAIEAALSKDWNEAIKLNLQILKFNSGNTDALSRLCKAYLETGNYRKPKRS